MDAPITDDRLQRDLRRQELARRLIAHQARTQTIISLTSLTNHQLFSLRQRWGVNQQTRHRGPSPQSFHVFWSSPSIRSEASALAILSVVAGALSTSSRGKNGKPLSNVEFGERLCDVLEFFSACVSHSALEFEHLALLVRGLTQGNVITIDHCGNCRAAILIDRLATRRHMCVHCQQRKDTYAEGSTTNDGDSRGRASTYHCTIQEEMF